MTTIITIAVLIFAVCLLIQTIFDIKKHDEYVKYQEMAYNNFGIDKDVFERYMCFAKELYGKNATPRDAYYIAYEEWYDEHYK